MRRQGTLPAAVVAGAILCLLILYAVWTGISGNVPPIEPGAPAEPGTPTGGNGTQTLNGIAYATTNVSLPRPSGTNAWTNATTVVFENVTFRLWTINWGSYSGVILEGTATEPNGARLGFAFIPTLSATRWIAPDGVFGVGELRVTIAGATVTLYVAKPMPPYGYLAVQVEYPAANGTPVVFTYVLDNVTFNLSVQHMMHGGPWLVGTAQVPNGTVYAFNVSGGGPPPVACSVVGNMPNYWGNAPCREWMATGRSVGFTWDGGIAVGLLVRRP